jgi:predicted molibdopterin-dependent oxidoreductase YjgC
MISRRLCGRSDQIPVSVNDAVKPGERFATCHTPAVFANQVTSPRRDRHTLSPEYKVTAVRIEKL